jgi:hypothetical protein
MKVEHPVPSRPESDPAAPRAMDEASIPTPLSDPNLKADGHTLAESSQPHHGSQNRPIEDPDTDLAFEKDELILTPDSRTLSSSPKIWQVKESPLKLSALEATVSVKRGLFTYDSFEM